MSKKYIKILIGIILILIIGIFCFVKFTEIKTVKTQTIIKEEPKAISQKVESKIKSKLVVEMSIGLKVLDKVYTTDIKDGATVYDAMVKIKNENPESFDFRYKDYPSLGIFVNEINGMKETPGKYWIYYINNKEASVGVSNYTLHSGDVISWKQE